jgi:hypothetical protein
MNKSCPVLTLEQREWLNVLRKIETQMLEDIDAAIDAAFAAAQAELAPGVMMDSTEDSRAPVRGYFVSAVHQKMFCDLCGADFRDFHNKIGDARKAAFINNNYRKIEELWKKTAEERAAD